MTAGFLLRISYSVHSAHLLQFNMADGDFHSAAGAQMTGQLLGKIHGAVLATGASKRDHQTFETAALITAYARIHQRLHVGQILVHAGLLIEIVDYGRVLAGQRTKLFFAPGIEKTARIEDISAAVTGLIGGNVAVE